MKSSSFLHIKREEVEKHGRERLQEARTAPFDWPVRTSGASAITLRTALLEQQPPPPRHDQGRLGGPRSCSAPLETCQNTSTRKTKLKDHNFCFFRHRGDGLKLLFNQEAENKDLSTFFFSLKRTTWIFFLHVYF